MGCPICVSIVVVLVNRRSGETGTDEHGRQRCLARRNAREYGRARNSGNCSMAMVIDGSSSGQGVVRCAEVEAEAEAEAEAEGHEQSRAGQQEGQPTLIVLCIKPYYYLR